MSHGIWTDEEWAFIRGFNTSAEPAVASVQELRVRDLEVHAADMRRERRARTSYLFVGIILGWGAAAAAYAVASRYADQCFDVVLPASSPAPVIERPVLPGT